MKQKFDNDNVYLKKMNILRNFLITLFHNNKYLKLLNHKTCQI